MSTVSVSVQRKSSRQQDAVWLSTASAFASLKETKQEHHTRHCVSTTSGGARRGMPPPRESYSQTRHHIHDPPPRPTVAAASCTPQISSIGRSGHLMHNRISPPLLLKPLLTSRVRLSTMMLRISCAGNRCQSAVYGFLFHKSCLPSSSTSAAYR